MVFSYVNCICVFVNWICVFVNCICLRRIKSIHVYKQSRRAVEEPGLIYIFSFIGHFVFCNILVFCLLILVNKSKGAWHDMTWLSSWDSTCSALQCPGIVCNIFVYCICIFYLILYFYCISIFIFIFIFVFVFYILVFLFVYLIFVWN